VREGCAEVTSAWTMNPAPPVSGKADTAFLTYLPSRESNGCRSTKCPERNTICAATVLVGGDGNAGNGMFDHSCNSREVVDVTAEYAERRVWWSAWTEMEREKGRWEESCLIVELCLGIYGTESLEVRGSALLQQGLQLSNKHRLELLQNWQVDKTRCSEIY
jgi:hypothetical protein